MSIKEVKKRKASHSEEDKHRAISSSVSTDRPGNYLFQIEPFSLLPQMLIKTKSDKYDSEHFEAGGYKWKLSLYPNGDKKRGGDGYISLYLVLAEPNSLPQGRVVNAMFKFFVFDHVNDNYLVLQDEKDRRFHALKTEWGIPKLLPLDVFSDASNGYLVDDCCAFGVEIFFHKNELKTGSLHIINNPHGSTYTWKINKFTTLTEVVYYSDIFAVGGCKWRLALYPRKDGIYPSLFLNLYELSPFPSGSKFFVEFTLSIKDQVNGKYHDFKGNNWFSASVRTWGWSKFLLRSDLNNASSGFTVNDTLIVGGKITFMSVVVNR